MFVCVFKVSPALHHLTDCLKAVSALIQYLFELLLFILFEAMHVLLICIQTPLLFAVHCVVQRSIRNSWEGMEKADLKGRKIVKRIS